MSTKPSIECAKNGPLLVKGLSSLVDLRDGAEIETRDLIALCRCGASHRKPFCDGGHTAVAFDDAKSPERTPDRREDYVGQHLTVHDNRGICAHAGFCTDELPEVFRMKDQPWIVPDNAPEQALIETIESCPSGALSYTRDGVEHRDRQASPKILVVPGGPYAVQGGVELKGVERGEGASQEHFDLCRCGESKNKPFCDGTHHGVSFDER